VRRIFMWLFALDRSTKRLIQVCFDVLAVLLCFWLAMALRLDGEVMAMSGRPWLVLLPVVPITIIAFVMLGLYRAVIRYMADRAVRTVAIGVSISAVMMFLLSQGFQLRVPRSVPGIYFALFFIVVGGTRFVMRNIYHGTQAAPRQPVLIYGAGEEGRQVLHALEQSRNYRPTIFVDENKKLSGSEIGGVRVMLPNEVSGKIKKIGIKTALIAISDKNVAGRRHAAQVAANLGLDVRMMPNMSDLVSGRVRISDFRRVTVEELLGRDPVPPLPYLMSKTTNNKSVMVTGAGGSIGRELCFQILEQRPKKLILYENSEFALYRILEDLKGRIDAQSQSTTVIPLLGSVAHESSVRSAIKLNAVETIFHAAAFKHVPLAEANVLSAIRNNVFGTKCVAEAAGTLGVKNFTLISTDKAVRPTNVMGATKRMAELVVQAAAEGYPATQFCSVRFGNVLGSSGSVIPKFNEQIRQNGPITVTDPNVTRYFMTITEAAQLVIQASAMTKLGKVFLLDMGEPVKILDLAQTMARLQGRSTYIEGQDTPISGGIAIKITGLRAGEKLYEELLIDENAKATEHPRIMLEVTKSQLSADETERAVSDLHAAVLAEDVARAISILGNMPIEYTHLQPYMSSIATVTVS
jgi:FlaA1/EpsC-like NDP-sugar epimerase